MPNDASTRPQQTSRPPPRQGRSPSNEAEARRREDRLYADLKVQGLIDLPPDAALQDRDGDVDR